LSGTVPKSNRKGVETEEKFLAETSILRHELFSLLKTLLRIGIVEQQLKRCSFILICVYV